MVVFCSFGAKNACQRLFRSLQELKLTQPQSKTSKPKHDAKSGKGMNHRAAVPPSFIPWAAAAAPCVHHRARRGFVEQSDTLLCEILAVS